MIIFKNIIKTLAMTIDYTKNAEGHFVCTHKGCTKTCARQNTMYYHVMRHRNEFAFKCEECDKGFIQKSAFLHHMAAIHPGNDTITIPNKNKNKTQETDVRVSEDPIAVVNDNDNNDIKIKNPYDGQRFTCPCCQHVTRTKANALVHYARLHAKDWIPTYNKDTGCSHCNKTFGSIAAYLYHCTGCIPTNKVHRDMISRMIESE
jgi:KRAB domain-containing zinc finger protein